MPLPPVLNQLAMSCADAEKGSPRSFSIDDGADASSGPRLCRCAQRAPAASAPGPPPPPRRAWLDRRPGPGSGPGLDALSLRGLSLNHHRAARRRARRRLVPARRHAGPQQWVGVQTPAPRPSHCGRAQRPGGQPSGCRRERLPPLAHPTPALPLAAQLGAARQTPGARLPRGVMAQPRPARRDGPTADAGRQPRGVRRLVTLPYP